MCVSRISDQEGEKLNTSMEGGIVVGRRDGIDPTVANLPDIQVPGKIKFSHRGSVQVENDPVRTCFLFITGVDPGPDSLFIIG